jgi:hypothetical protein
MAVTASDIITDALQWIGVQAPGETITDADAQRCLSNLNDMLDGWSNESLTCYAYVQQSAALQVGVQTYTIGTGGTFNMTRPLRLLKGPGAAYVLDTNNNKYQMNVVEQPEWNMIPNSGSTVTSNFPDTLFYDPQFPLGNMNFFPYPTIAYTAYWFSFLQLTDFATLATVVSLPPGYKDALQTNLGIRVWPYFKKGDPSGWQVKMAGDALGKIKRTNMRPNVAVYDPELFSRGGNSYNIYTDRPTR